MIEEAREVEKISKNPLHFGDGFRDVIRLLKDLDASVEDAKRAGKHPYFWMKNSEVEDMWESMGN